MNEKKKIKILIVDDDPILLKATEKIISSEGYIVSTAESGAGCMKALEKEIPDLILLDVVMPDISGRDLVGQIKGKYNPSPLIILTSGMEISSEKQAQGLEMGADGYIPRPISNRELIARVNSFSRIKNSEIELNSLKANLEKLVKNKSEELRNNIQLSYQREFRIKELRERIKELEADEDSE